MNAKWIAVVPVFFLLSGCGRQSSLDADNSAAFQKAATQQFGSPPAATNPLVQSDLKTVMNEVQSAIATALVAQSSGGASSKIAVAKVATTGCAPSFGFVMVGINITFASSATCPLSGTVAVTLFPLTATAALSVSGLSFISGISFNANITMSPAMSGTVDIKFLNLSINLLQALGTITANAHVAIGLGTDFTVNSRINAFLSGGSGVALLDKIDTNAGIAQLQGCLLTGGDPNNPDAGTTTTCFTL